MVRDSYSGGSSLIRSTVHSGGASIGFEGSFDPADPRGAYGPSGIAKKKIAVPKRSETTSLRFNEGDQLIRSHVSQCVKLYLDNKLSTDRPVPPKQLRKRIERAGGNLKWLEANPKLQRLFYKSYCQFLGKCVPYSKVWRQNRNKLGI